MARSSWPLGCAPPHELPRRQCHHGKVLHLVDEPRSMHALAPCLLLGQFVRSAAVCQCPVRSHVGGGRTSLIRGLAKDERRDPPQPLRDGRSPSATAASVYLARILGVLHALERHVRVEGARDGEPPRIEE